MHNDARPKRRIIVNRLSISVVGLALSAILAFPICADEFTFTVVEVSSGSVLLKSEVQCAPGTLINMLKPDASNRVVTLKVLAKRGRDLYVAIPEFGDVKLAELKQGDIGSTNSPLQNFTRTQVFVDSVDSRIRAQLEGILETEYAAVIKIEKTNLTSNTIELHLEKGSQKKVRFILKSPLGQEEGEKPIADLARDVVTAAKSVIWLGLNNPFLSPKQSTVQFVRLSGSGNQGEQSQIKVGSPFDIQITSSLSSYVCVLKLDKDGKIRVLFPNSGSRSDVQYLPLVPRFLRDSMSDFILSASKPGPVNFVVLFSTVPRPISAFLPKTLLGTFVTVDGRDELNPSTIGPGYYQSANLNDVASVEDSPETWDVTNGVLLVSP